MTQQDWDSGFDDLMSRYSFRMVPQVQQIEGGAWRGRYPGMDWSVIADSRVSAIEKLQTEDLRRTKDDPTGYWMQFAAVVRQHLDRPIPGVQFLDRDDYERIKSGPDAEAELERAFSEANAANVDNASEE